MLRKLYMSLYVTYNYENISSQNSNILLLTLNLQICKSSFSLGKDITIPTFPTMAQPGRGSQEALKNIAVTTAFAGMGAGPQDYKLVAHPSPQSPAEPGKEIGEALNNTPVPRAIPGTGGRVLSGNLPSLPDTPQQNLVNKADMP